MLVAVSQSGWALKYAAQDREIVQGAVSESSEALRGATLNTQNNLTPPVASTVRRDPIPDLLPFVEGFVKDGTTKTGRLRRRAMSSVAVHDFAFIVPAPNPLCLGLGGRARWRRSGRLLPKRR